MIAMEIPTVPKSVKGVVANIFIIGCLNLSLDNQFCYKIDKHIR